MIIPSVLAALCSAFQPFEGRVEPAPFYIFILSGKKRRMENIFFFEIIHSILFLEEKIFLLFFLVNVMKMVLKCNILQLLSCVIKV